MPNKRKFDLQFFADGEETESNDQPETKVFDEVYVKELREEAANWRTKYREMEQTVSAKEQKAAQDVASKLFSALGLEPDPSKEFDKQLSEAQAKAQEAEKRANDRLIKAEIKLVASELGIIDPEAAYALMAKDGVAIDETGSVTGVKEALTTLVEAKPYLKGKPQNLGSDTNPGDQKPPKVDVANMSSEDFAKLQARVLAGETIKI